MVAFRTTRVGAASAINRSGINPNNKPSTNTSGIDGRRNTKIVICPLDTVLLIPGSQPKHKDFLRTSAPPLTSPPNL
jgi:hypothetical protein